MTDLLRDDGPAPSKDTRTVQSLGELKSGWFGRRGSLVRVDGAVEWRFVDDMGPQRWRSVDGKTGMDALFEKVT